MSDLRRLASRIAFLAVLAGAGALVWFGLAEPYRAWLDGAAARVEATASLVERYRTMAPAPPEPASEDSGLFLPELSEAQTTAFLQRLVQAHAGTGGVEIAGMQVLPLEEERGLRRVGLRVRGSGDIAAVAALLHALETARPLILVDNLRLQGRAGRGEAKLDLQLDAVGFTARPAT